MRTFLYLLTAALMITTSGCLTSEDAFYQPSDIKVDDRLVGTYGYEKEKSSWLIEKDLDHSDRYFITLFGDVSRPCNMRFGATLFLVGTNRFLDMLPLPEACDHIAGSPPSAIEILQSLTLLPLHLVVRVDDVTTNGLRYSVVEERSLQAIAKKNPEYFQSPTSGQLPRMVTNTQKQREFLLRFGGDTNIFQSAELKRAAK